MRFLRWWREPLWNPPDKLTLGWVPFNWLTQDVKRLMMGDIINTIFEPSPFMLLLDQQGRQGGVLTEEMLDRAAVPRWLR